MVVVTVKTTPNCAVQFHQSHWKPLDDWPVLTMIKRAFDS